MHADLSPSGNTASPDLDAKFLVACLCAAWCGTCRDYRKGFFELAKFFPDAALIWLDVDDDAQLIGHLDVENFPGILIQHDDAVLFFGAMLPDHNQLKRLIQALGSQSAEEVDSYIKSSPERQLWQDQCNLRQRLRDARLP